VLVDIDSVFHEENLNEVYQLGTFVNRKRSYLLAPQTYWAMGLLKRR
jgi:hypothetical protein